MPDSETVVQFEKLVPRSSYYINLPFWKLLTEELSKEEIVSLLFSSSKTYKNLIFRSNSKERKKYNLDKLIRRLIIDGTFESLSIVCLLLAEIEFDKKEINYGFIEKHFNSLLQIVRNICLEERFSPFYTQLTELICTRFLFYWTKLCLDNFGYDFDLIVIHNAYFQDENQLKNRIIKNQKFGEYVQDRYLTDPLVTEHIKFSKRSEVNKFLAYIDECDYKIKEKIFKTLSKNKKVKTKKKKDRTTYFLLDSFLVSTFKLRVKTYLDISESRIL